MALLFVTAIRVRIQRLLVDVEKKLLRNLSELIQQMGEKSRSCHPSHLFILD